MGARLPIINMKDLAEGDDILSLMKQGRHTVVRESHECENKRKCGLGRYIRSRAPSRWKTMSAHTDAGFIVTNLNHKGISEREALARIDILLRSTE